jgi:hypothetical protein
MAKANLFLLLPETEPSNLWMRSTIEHYSDIAGYELLIKQLCSLFESITVEEYGGFYDKRNIDLFMNLYNTLEDCYPAAPRRVLRTIFLTNGLVNWRDEAKQSSDRTYSIFSQNLTEGNTFCELAERITTTPTDTFALLNHYACKIVGTIKVCINNTNQVEIHNLQTEFELSRWFALHRRPPRVFNINPKHGEQRQTVRIVNGETISPLRCSRADAQLLLNTAIGISARELYNIDLKFSEIIVFKNEGSTPQNTYHGYHVSMSSAEVPSSIRAKLAYPHILKA